jgi:O-antigen/teichoic acid export membrane protein
MLERSPSSLALNGILSLGTSQFARVALQLGVTATLARLLAPKEFGLIAAVLAVIGVGEILRDAGMSNAAIQLRTLTDGLRDNLFWINVAIGGLLTLATFAAAPLLAQLYHDPAVSGVTMLLAPIFLFSSLGAQHRVTLVRSMRFHALGSIEFASALIGAASAVGAALFGLGVGALIVQSYATSLSSLGLLWWAARWTPKRAGRNRGTRPVLTTGSHFLGSSLLTYVSLNADSVIVARTLGLSAAGLYNRSSTLIRTPARQLLSPTVRVMLPVISREWGSPDEVLRLARRFQLMSALPLLPLIAVAIGAPTQLVNLILGPAWAEAAPLIPFFAISALMASLAGVAAVLLIAGGYGRPLLGLSIVTTIVDVTFMLIGSGYGLQGIAIAIAASPAVSWTMSLAVTAQVTGLRTLPLIGRATVVGCTGVGVALLGRVVIDGLPPTHDVVDLVIATAFGGLSIAVLFIVPGARRDLSAAVAHITRAVRSRRQKPTVSGNQQRSADKTARASE